MKNPRNIVITGASSGIGEALAYGYAAPDITLYLHGRNEKRLQHAARQCEARGAKVSCHTGDVCDAVDMKAWLEASDAATPVDLVIANAGISAGTGFNGESEDQARRIFATNIDGVLNTIQPLLPRMLKRKRGQIALMSSLAGIRGLPSSPAYSASKACVRIYGEGLRGWLAPHGVEINVLCPGWVRTSLTAINEFPMPFIMEPDRAAAIMIRGLARNKARIAMPGVIYWPLSLINCLPVSWTDPFFARLPGKAPL